MRSARITLALLLLTLVAGLVALPIQTDAAPLDTPLQPNASALFGAWSLDEESGTRNDALNRDNLSDNNTVGSAAGKSSLGASFISANSEYLSYGDTSWLSTGDVSYTFCLWASISSNAANRPLISKWGNAGQREYKIYYASSSDRFVFEVSNDGTASGTVTANTFGAPSMNTFYFICAWHDAANDTLNIQVNNGSVNSAAHATGSYDSETAFYIGRAGAEYHDGNIDEIVFYKNILTADEREYLYNSGNGQPVCNVACLNNLSLLAPSGSMVIFDNIFVWDGSPGATHYVLDLYDSSDNAIISQSFMSSAATSCSNGGDLECYRSFDLNLSNGIYHWRVVAYNVNVYTYGRWSDFVYFTISPATLTPSHTATATFTNTPITPTFTFTPTHTFTPTFTLTPTNTGTPSVPTSQIQGAVTYGDYSTTVAISLLCLVLILGIVGWVIFKAVESGRRNRTS